MALERKLRWMALRHAAFFVGGPMYIAFGISSPRHAAFWVVLVAVVTVTAPIAGVVLWFYREIRRLTRENANPS
jgi:nitrate reductase gamma subunit